MAPALRTATCSCSTSAAPAPRTRSAAPRSKAELAAATLEQSSSAAPTDRPRPRRLHDPGIGPGHRGAAPGRRLLEARPVRHLLRHQGRARVRRTLSRSTSKRWCSTRWCPPTGRNRSRSPPSRRSRRCSRELCSGAPAPASPATPLADLARSDRHEPAPPLSGSVFDGSGNRHAVASRAGRCFELLARRRPEPGAARAAAGGGPLGAARRPRPAAAPAGALGGLIPTCPPREAKQRRRPTKRCSSTTTCEETPFPWQRSAPARRGWPKP